MKTILDTIATHPVATTCAVLSTAFLAIIALAPYIFGNSAETLRAMEAMEKAEEAAKKAADDKEYGQMR